VITEKSVPTWAGALGRRLVPDRVLAPLTTLKIGGPADWYFEATTPDDLVLALSVARGAAVPFTLLGDGSNVLISDLGIRGLVIHNRARTIERRGNDLYSESGALLATLVERSRIEGLTGLEFASGIYGSVGGAVFGNAGAYGRAMADIMIRAEVCTRDGRRLEVSPADLGFSYRKSACSEKGWVVLSCEVRLDPGVGEAIGAEIARIISVRAAKLPADLPSAGSYFKNIEDPRAEYGKVPAGKLLEEIGAKGMRVGGAGVYERHANVIVNLGGATAADVLELADRMAAAVREKFTIELESEVRFLGEPMPRR
jgi:UDP-N-acetylmuramate dehydrogenase